MSVDTAVELPELTAHDRCDKCSSQAFMRAYKDQYELLFCGHHGNKYFPQLFSQGFLVQDETHKIDAT